MEFVASGLVSSVVLGAIAWCIVDRLTRSRSGAPLARGRAERAIQYGAGIVCGPLILVVIASGLESRMGSQEVGIIGIVVAAPVSAVVTWTAGELLSGPTHRSWRPMVLAFLAAQAGLWAALLTFSYFDRYVLHDFAGGAAELAASFVVGGFASAWAYRRWRSEMAVMAVNS
jgi:hypothetical protein